MWPSEHQGDIFECATQQQLPSKWSTNATKPVLCVWACQNMWERCDLCPKTSVMTWKINDAQHCTSWYSCATYCKLEVFMCLWAVPQDRINATEVHSCALASVAIGIFVLAISAYPAHTAALLFVQIWQWDCISWSETFKKTLSITVCKACPDICRWALKLLV